MRARNDASVHRFSRWARVAATLVFTGAIAFHGHASTHAPRDTNDGCRAADGHRIDVAPAMVVEVDHSALLTNRPSGGERELPDGTS